MVFRSTTKYLVGEYAVTLVQELRLKNPSRKLPVSVDGRASHG